MNTAPLGWISIVRLGLVQTALGAIVVLTTSTLNRVMVVELALPAMLPGALVALHYAVQLSRPRWGYGSDVGGRSTPWIIGGICVLATGGICAALATALMSSQFAPGLALAIFAFLLIGAGVGASGTSLLALLAKRVDARRRPAAATIVWMMMICGFVITATLAGHFLDPYSPSRLVTVVSLAAAAAVVVTIVAVWNIEGRSPTPVPRAGETPATPRVPFRLALQEVWSEPQSRRFTIFVFVSMLAYSAQDLILEPFAGSLFGFTVGESTRLAGVQHGGVLIGMILVALAASGNRRGWLGSLRIWTIGGCVASGIALSALVVAGYIGPGWPLRETVLFLGIANGVFAVAAIASMMSLAGTGRESREGLRMGLWGAAQALAFGLGGFMGTVLVDLVRYLTGGQITPYATVFALEALMFIVAAGLAARIGRAEAPPAQRWKVSALDHDVASAGEAHS